MKTEWLPAPPTTQKNKKTAQNTREQTADCLAANLAVFVCSTIYIEGYEQFKSVQCWLCS